jgi:hypothetical protein
MNERLFSDAYFLEHNIMYEKCIPYLIQNKIEHEFLPPKFSGEYTYLKVFIQEDPIIFFDYFWTFNPKKTKNENNFKTFLQILEQAKNQV